MSMDQIIKELEAMFARVQYDGVSDHQLLTLMLELARHVKAQEPEPLNEEEILALNKGE